MQEEPDEDSQCLSDDTDTEISTQVSISEPPFIYLQPLFKTTSALWMLCLYLRMHGSAQSAENTTYLSRGTVFGAGL